MQEKIESKFKKAYLDFLRKPKIAKYLKSLSQKLKTLKKESDVLEKFMNKEYLDIVKLEKRGLRSTFNLFLGSREEALDKERQEYLIVVLKYQANAKEIKTVEFKIEVLNRKLSELGDVDKRFKTQKSRYFKNLQRVNKNKAKRIVAVRAQAMKSKSKQGEIRQAQIAGNKATLALEKLSKELDKIDIWGYPNSRAALDYDGKGRFSSYKKKRFIDRTKALTFKVNGFLNRFNEELKDVSIALKIDFHEEIESIKNFLGLFFDNLITDWIVKNEIKLAYMALEMVHDKIQRIKQMLDFEYDRIEEDVEKLLLVETEILLEQ